jgi:hypothetical protein
MKSEPCTRRNKLTHKERMAAFDRGMCMNGCNKPIKAPSKVVCEDCLEAMGNELRAMLVRLENG